MKRFISLTVCLLVLSACIRSSESHSAVEQAALLTERKDMREAVEYIEPLLAARGFRSDSIHLERKDAAVIYRWYRGPSGSSASLSAKDGCISFVTFVKKGAQDFIAAKTLFDRVLGQLSQDGSWKIKSDQSCQHAP
jgi:hypothetical protein